MTSHGLPGPARPWRARSPAAAMTAAFLLLAYSERVFLARLVVELLLRIAQIAG
jgi:hypothetical protein